MEALHRNEATQEKEGESDLDNSQLDGVELIDEEEFLSPEQRKKKM